VNLAAGVPTFELDALSSAAYGPEAGLTISASTISQLSRIGE
jgi:hypothetical protein